mgnify:CR=1 FL=1
MGDNTNKEIHPILRTDTEKLTSCSHTTSPLGNFIKDEWRCCMKEIIKNTRRIAHDRTWILLKPPQSFCNTKPRSYYHQVLTILPLCQRLESFPNSCNALCVKRFMERHGISDVIEPMQHLLHNLQGLSNNYFGLP